MRSRPAQATAYPCQEVLVLLRLNLRREKRSYTKWTKTSSSLAEAMNDCFAYVFFFFFFHLRRFIRFKAEVLRQTICSLDVVVSSLSEITRRHFYIG